MENKIFTRATILIATFLIALPLVPVNVMATPSVSITPGSINTDIGGSFTASVMLSGATSSSVVAYDIIVRVNPDVLIADSQSDAGNLLQSCACGSVDTLKSQVFPSIGYVRYAATILGGGAAIPSASALLVNMNFKVNDPSVPGPSGLFATSSEYPSEIQLFRAEIAVLSPGGGVIGLQITTSSGTYMPPADTGLRNVGCRAVNDGFNTIAKGFTDPIFCRDINTGTQTISVASTFSFRSLGGVTGSVTSAQQTLAPGQAGEQDAALTVPNANDIFIVTGATARQINFNDGSVLTIPGPSDTFKIEVNVP